MGNVTMRKGTNMETRNHIRASVRTEVRFTTPYTDTYVTWVPGGSTFNVHTWDDENVDVFTRYSEEKGTGQAPSFDEAQRFAADWFADVFLAEEADSW